MGNKYLRVIFFVVIILFIILISTATYADSGLDEVIDGANITKAGSNGQAVETGNSILSTVRTAGIMASVIALMVLGIKYMTSTLEEKANMKKAIPYYIFGLIMVAAIIVIMKVIESVVNGALG